MAASSGTGDWVHVRSPFVYWAQTEKSITLRIDIRNAQSPQINIEEFKVTFDATGRGAHGETENEYHFELDLPHAIVPKKSNYRVLDRDIDIQLEKGVLGWWSKVITSHKKPAWLKVDFDRWKSPDDEDELPQDIMKDFPDMMDQVRTEELGYKVESLRKVYLFMYNLFQFVGYLYIVGVLTVRYLKEGQDVTRKAYEFVGFTLCYCQVLQFLEVVHAILGFTKTGIPMAILQWAGRFVILFGIIRAEERLQSHPAVFYIFYVWALAELFRYPFYMLQIYKTKASVVTWLRYSAWIPLYPIGIMSECVIIFNAISYFVETEKFSIALPNSLNVSFYYPAIMRIYLLFGVFPVTTFILKSMWRSRQKVLGKAVIRIKKEKVN